ncbi:pyridoxamine 5'-phosphate oxidase family protein [Bowmanella yangjiangensis]|uniref:Pyridoxamine 5'-phosphate oxidase family protein n=1 Tax=Bowmanella yangjiangensis TaxID=2811230 RepID=A0ABS3CTR5_9ALTE|nr:pyridoxamine 5'-phosphate oxidase family protein [Bowmanella yangjiangensis]MBN7819821.1 pyridoxamine 5'-phosphate oxidase family protein [Bowmanella yangjiangensis]
MSKDLDNRPPFEAIGGYIAESVWHAGERYMHRRAGVLDHMERHGRRVIQDHLTSQHQEFYAALPLLVVGTIDQQGNPWGSIIEGRQGFLSSPNPNYLDINASIAVDDPVLRGFNQGAGVGILGIDFQTRRRNRLNGELLASNNSCHRIKVVQAFGNCPKYIQQQLPVLPPKQAMTEFRETDSLDAQTLVLVRQAHTFFVVSYADDSVRPALAKAVDVSHRGGLPGFIKASEHSLFIPDWPGNNYFNTLGNIQVNPKVGLLFANFSTGELVHITGSARILWEEDPGNWPSGAQLVWKFDIARVIHRRYAMSSRFRFADISPYSTKMGTW